jgi:glycosyltransferase involved in cell wall biosynthesis
MTTRMLVLPAAAIAPSVNQGEVVARYYNPGDVFDEIHFVLHPGDTPDQERLARMAGRARVVIHSLRCGVRGAFFSSLGWRPTLLGGWAEQFVEIAASVRPHLVRCWGGHLNAYAALEIRKRLGIPYAVSIHTTPDPAIARRFFSRRQRLLDACAAAAARTGLRGADVVMPVYGAILPWLGANGITRAELAYNFVGGGILERKAAYGGQSLLQVITLGRMVPGKDPGPIVEAMAALPGHRLTVIGDGPLLPGLRACARQLGLGDRVTFTGAMANEDICRALARADMVALRTHYRELSKATMEAMLVGLPVVINREAVGNVPELMDDSVMACADHADGFARALAALSDDAVRERLGRRAAALAWERWSPERAEERQAAVHRRLCVGSGSSAP